MPLVGCIECGAPVSPTAHTCPKCRRAPRGGTCVICGGVIKIEDGFRIKDWESSGARLGAKMMRADKFAHKSCVMDLFHETEAPCVDCGEAINIRAFLQAIGPTLLEAGDPKKARWSTFTDEGWNCVEDAVSAPVHSCPGCGSTTVLARGARFTSKCRHCRLPVLAFHEATADPESGLWVHDRCSNSRIKDSESDGNDQESVQKRLAKLTDPPLISNFVLGMTTLLASLVAGCLAAALRH